MDGNNSQAVTVTTARCKFKCSTVTEMENYDTSGTTVSLEVNLTAVGDDALSKEDCSFAKYTPNGKLAASITNPALTGFFKPGKRYYVDITEAPE